MLEALRRAFAATAGVSIQCFVRRYQALALFRALKGM